MKPFIITFIFLWSFIQLNAQKINLPVYKVGQFSSDTIFKHFGNMGDTEDGSITFQNKLTSTLLTGVKFYVLIDTIDKGGAPAGVTTAYIITDSSRTAKKGDKYELPVKFKVFAGKIGFSIIIEGTPQISNEAYYCDLMLLLPTCNCMAAVLTNKTEQQCNVTIPDGIQSLTNEPLVVVYPNPASHTTMFNAPSSYAGKPYSVIDSNGKQVLTGITSNGTTTINTNNLPAGNYYIQIQEVRKALSIIK